MHSQNLVDMIAQARVYEAHRRKIDSIRGKTSGISYDRPRMEVLNNFYSNRQRATRFSQRAKQQTVEKENDLILRKIIDTSNRRRATSHAQPETSRVQPHSSLKNLKQSIKTINEQNQRIAQKLVSTTSALSQDKVGSTYRRHL